MNWLLSIETLSAAALAIASIFLSSLACFFLSSRKVTISSWRLLTSVMASSTLSSSAIFWPRIKFSLGLSSAVGLTYSFSMAMRSSLLQSVPKLSVPCKSNLRFQLASITL
jgi:hypothetical protein